MAALRQAHLRLNRILELRTEALNLHRLLLWRDSMRPTSVPSLVEADSVA